MSTDPYFDLGTTLGCGRTELLRACDHNGLKLVVIEKDRGDGCKAQEGPKQAIPIRLNCPICNELHVDKGVWATKLHHTYSCQSCGHTWRPAVVDTVGVQFLPGFKNEE